MKIALYLASIDLFTSMWPLLMSDTDSITTDSQLTLYCAINGIIYCHWQTVATETEHIVINNLLQMAVHC